MSARDSQGGPSPRPCPGVPGLSRFTPPPQHRPSCLRAPLVPSVLTRMQPLLAAVSPAPNSCSGAPLSCACPLPLSRPRSILPFPSRTWDSAADPHIPQFCRHGDGLGQSDLMWCEVRVPEACRVRPAHNTQEGPQRHAGGACSGLLISGCQHGHRGLGDCLTGEARQSPADHSRRAPPRPAPPREVQCSRGMASPSGALVLPGGAGRAPTPRTAPGVLTDRPGGHALSPSWRPGGEGNCLLWEGVQ